MVPTYQVNQQEEKKDMDHCIDKDCLVAAGPIGRNAEASGAATLKHIAAIYSYSKTRGLFAGTVASRDQDG